LFTELRDAVRCGPTRFKRAEIKHRFDLQISPQFARLGLKPVTREYLIAARVFSVGYFSFDSDLDLNIVIRTLILAGGSAHLQVGGAILAESDPEAEYQETLDKAGPILDLLQGKGRV